MRTYIPDDEYDEKIIKREKIEPWMLEMLALNPSYTCWGPYEDYMSESGDGWRSRVIVNTWEDFGPWELDELNELVNFYFTAGRESELCASCNGSGLNKETKKLSDSWYRYMGGEDHWSDKLIQEEVDALYERGRLFGYTKYDLESKKHVPIEGVEKPTAEEINEAYRQGIGHDSINHWICVKSRAKRLGIFGYCEVCKEGTGQIFIEDKPKLGLVLWFLHPRKGASRGVHIKKIEKSQVKEVLEYLKVAAKRNENRFAAALHLLESKYEK